ncbi:MAG: Wzz/FepE/Etk N-terminal domain-containing protein [Candidatus Manganitrophaceae bacterium]
MPDFDSDIDLLNLWRVLVKRKKILALMVGMALVTSLVVSFLLPPAYESTASILPPQQDSSIGSNINMMAPMMAPQISSGAGGLAGGLLGLKSPADLWVGILRSQTVRDAMIRRFDLSKVYNEKTAEDAREALDDRVKIVKAREEIISITVEDTDPKRAAEMAAAFVEELDRVNKNVTMTSGGRMRSFIEKRLKEANEELLRVEEAVKAFQEKNVAVKLDDQSKAIIGAIGGVKGELMAKEVELQTLLSYATLQNPQVEILKAQIRELKEGLRELEEGKGGGGSSKSIFIPTARIPDLAIQYTRLLREAKVQETLYALLTQQYEMARIQEAKDSPTVQVLDVAKTPEKKIKPRRVLIVFSSGVLAVFFALFIIFFLESIEKTRPKGIRAADLEEVKPKKAGLSVR